MALSAALPRSRAIALPALRLPRPSEEAVVFVLMASLYVAVAYALVFWGNALANDGVSRVATANRILFSRDPHLAAIGFVWSPLPNLVLLPLVPFKFLWPALVQKAFAGNIVSSLFMAGAVWQLLGFLREIGVKRAMRLALAA
ncbi:MAG TPA: ABC transporter, partial [Verrucomicrobiae bacterium]|nr:ABC transporter [Verrucomicrobiae bacterium]